MAGLTGNANLTSGGITYALFIVFTLCTYFFIDSPSLPLSSPTPYLR